MDPCRVGVWGSCCVPLTELGLALENCIGLKNAMRTVLGRTPKSLLMKTSPNSLLITAFL